MRVLLAALVGVLAAAAATAAPAAPHLLFAAVPVARHADPLLEIARGVKAALEADGRAVRVSFATADWFAAELGQDNGLDLLALQAGAPRLDADALPRAALRELYEDRFARALLELFGEGAAGMPDLVVADRYTFGGIAMAQARGLPLIVHNPWTLLDVDDPPGFVAARARQATPLLLGQDVLSRAANLWDRLADRIEELDLVRESAEQVRTALGLGPLPARVGRCERALVLSDTVLGWLDDPRSLPPLQQVVGAVLPPVDGRGAPPGRNATVQVLVQDGAVDQAAHGVLRDASQALGFDLARAPARCSGEALLQRCGASERVVLVTGGDLACVQLAGLCRNFGGVLVAPRLAEQREVAARVRLSGIGAMLDFNNSSGRQRVTDRLREAALSQRARDNLDRFGDALRLAGGTPRAVYWVRAILDLGLDRFLPLECDLPWYERYMLDVLAFFMCVLASLAFLGKAAWAIASLSLGVDFSDEFGDPSAFDPVALRSLDLGNKGANGIAANGLQRTPRSWDEPAREQSESPPHRSPTRVFSYERVTRSQAK